MRTWNDVGRLEVTWWESGGLPTIDHAAPRIVMTWSRLERAILLGWVRVSDGVIRVHGSNRTVVYREVDRDEELSDPESLLAWPD